jgi:hypothetical protein
MMIASVLSETRRFCVAVDQERLGRIAENRGNVIRNSKAEAGNERIGMRSILY